MKAFLDHLVAATQAHRDNDVPVAAEHYIAAAALAINHNDVNVRAFLAFCRRFISSYYNENHVWDENGEVNILNRLAAHEPKVVFDVGAQHGHWSERAQGVLPGAAIHSFEIFPDTARTLIERIGSLPNVFINSIGLYDKVGEVEVRYAQNSDFNYLNSIVNPHKGLDRSLMAKVTTGDLYMAERGIERIDFLKIDAEGAERAILDGFQNAFRAEAIDMVQFEYGKVNVHCHALLYDFYQFFGDNGFEIGLVYPNGVQFKPYSYEDENFLGLNFLAVRRARPDLIATMTEAVA